MYIRPGFKTSKSGRIPIFLKSHNHSPSFLPFTSHSLALFSCANLIVNDPPGASLHPFWTHSTTTILTKSILRTYPIRHPFLNGIFPSSCPTAPSPAQLPIASLAAEHPFIVFIHSQSSFGLQVETTLENFLPVPMLFHGRIYVWCTLRKWRTNKCNVFICIQTDIRNQSLTHVRNVVCVK
jgi:hypothetical protein